MRDRLIEAGEGPATVRSFGIYQLLVLIPESNELDDVPLENDEELTELDELPNVDLPEELPERLPKPPNELRDDELPEDPKAVSRNVESTRLILLRRASRALLLRSRSLRTRFAAALAVASSPLAEDSDWSARRIASSYC